MHRIAPTTVSRRTTGDNQMEAQNIVGIMRILVSIRQRTNVVGAAMKMPIPRRPDKEAMRVDWSRAIIILG